MGAAWPAARGAGGRTAWLPDRGDQTDHARNATPGTGRCTALGASGYGTLGASRGAARIAADAILGARWLAASLGVSRYGLLEGGQR